MTSLQRCLLGLCFLYAFWNPQTQVPKMHKEECQSKHPSSLAPRTCCSGRAEGVCCPTSFSWVR